MQERMRKKDDQSVRLQGVPPGMGTGTGMGLGLGRRRTRSAGRACVRIHVHTYSHINGKISVLASNLSTLVWGCEQVQEELRAGNVGWGWGEES
jgi:hypothetical protein